MDKYNLSLPAETIDELLLWLDDKQGTIIKQTDLLSGTGQSTTATMTQKAITDAINAGYQYKGMATPATNPGTPDANVFYLASEAGTYTNFGGKVINEGEVCALVWNGAWTKEVTGIASADKLNQLGEEVEMTPKFLFAKDCPLIKEMYINELGVAADVAIVNDITNTRLKFANTAGTAFVAHTKGTEKSNGIIPIRDDSDESIIYGYVVVDWSYITGAEWEYYANKINDIAKDINYSPSIKDYLAIQETRNDALLFASVPWIKELYVNELGVSEDVAIINNIVQSTGRIRFANTPGNAFVASIYFDNSVGLFPIVKDGDITKVLGYAVIDGVTGKQQADSTPIIRLNSKQYSLDYSPSIKTYLLQEGKIKDIEDYDKEICPYEGDKKNLIPSPSSFDVDTYIFWQNPKQRIYKVDTLRFKSHLGTVYFYKVTVNGTIATWTSIASFVNDSSEEGTIKEETITPVTLADNEYIGINGAFYIDTDDTQGYTSARALVSTGAVSQTVALITFEALNSLSTYARLDRLEKKTIDPINTTIDGIGHSVGDTIPNTTNIVVLATDGSGDYTSFVDANDACNQNGATLIIMPGLYNIPVRTTGDYNVIHDIIGIGNPVLKCVNDATGDDFVTIKQEFSPFRMYSRHTSHKTYKIEGITLIVENVRYCVHDEMGNKIAPSYTHIFRNCKFEHLSDPDSDWGFPRCIGGGLGSKGLIVIENCEFNSKIATSVDYHSGYDGDTESSKVIIKDCLLANNTVSATSISLASDKSIMVVQGCVLNAEPIYNNQYGTNDMELIVKDNIIV